MLHELVEGIDEDCLTSPLPLLKGWSLIIEWYEQNSKEVIAK